MTYVKYVLTAGCCLGRGSFKCFELCVFFSACSRFNFTPIEIWESRIALATVKGSVRGVKMNNGLPSREQTLLSRQFAHYVIQSEIHDDSKGESASFPLNVFNSNEPQEALAKLAIFKLAKWSYPRNSRITTVAARFGEGYGRKGPE